MSRAEKMTQRPLKTVCCSLLLLASVIQGLQDVPVFHYKTKEVLVGQNASLPCFIENISNDTFISSIEWSKNNTPPTKLALYIPGHGHHYFNPKVTLRTIHNGTDKLMGTHLEVPNVSKGDAGAYICAITSFPKGSLRKETELRVKDNVECNVNSTIEVNSGENVTIHCSEFPDVEYTWSKDEKVVVAERASLRILSVSEASAGLYTLTADTGNNRLQATFTIKVLTQTTDYWADISSLSPSYNSSSGSSDATSRPPVTAFSTEDISNSTTTIPTSHSQTMKSQNTPPSSTMNTAGLLNTQSAASEGFNHTETYHTTQNYSQDFNQSEAVNTDTLDYNQSGTTTVPFVHNISTEYAIINDSGSGFNLPHDNFSKAFTSSTLAPDTTSRTAAETQTSSTRSSTDVTTQPDPPNSEEQSQLVLTLSIIGAVLLIIVAFMLYRRRMIKKRMSLPPSFKPPPPPVKYTAVRNPQQDFPTDRCNSVAAGASMEMRQTLV